MNNNRNKKMDDDYGFEEEEKEVLNNIDDDNVIKLITIETKKMIRIVSSTTYIIHLTGDEVHNWQ